jgi:aminoglycoside 2'-N-acetyltransferase I
VLSNVDIVVTTEPSDDLLHRVHSLLLDAFGDDFSDDDWDNTVGGIHVVLSIADTIVSHAAIVTRRLEVDGRPFRTGYVEGVATASARRGQGFGTIVMREVTARLQHGDFEMGALSTGSHDFYGRLGWERWRGPTFVRQGTVLRRTEEEDDGVMVLRFGPSATVDLRASISCEQRRGDDW